MTLQAQQIVVVRFLDLHITANTIIEECIDSL